VARGSVVIKTANSRGGDETFIVADFLIKNGKTGETILEIEERREARIRSSRRENLVSLSNVKDGALAQPSPGLINVQH
jgi:phosphopantetheinyl transferase (holo-ACP synthase)